MASNLTSLYDFKLYAGIASTTTDDDNLIIALIEQTGVALESYCGRTWTSTTYKQWMDGTGTPWLTLPNWPITKAYGVGLADQNVASIKFTGGSYAVVHVADGTMQLLSIATDGTETETSITLATYPTIGDLETQVETVSGWSMEVISGKSTEPSTLIRPVYGGWALSPDDVDLDIPDEVEVCGIMDESRQTLERPRGLIFPSGRENVFVWYVAGYTLSSPYNTNIAPTTAGNVPKDLVMIANSIVKTALDGSKQTVGALKSERIGNYQYTLDDSARSAIDKGIMDNAQALSIYKSSKLT
jgi:hypothetical protein